MTSNDGNGRYRGPDKAAPYPISRLSPPISLVETAREIERAQVSITSHAASQLEVIAEQIRLLQAKAQEVLNQARQDAELHRAEARFTRIAGKVYHLYQRPDESRYWSLLSPADWNNTAPHTFVGSYRLEADQSWTALQDAEKRDANRAGIDELLHHKLRLGSQ